MPGTVGPGPLPDAGGTVTSVTGVTNETDSTGGTTPAIGLVAVPIADNFVSGLASTVTAAGTTVLTVASKGVQVFSGSTTQTVTLPVVTALPQLGFGYRIVNLSTGAVTVNSSGGNAVQVITAGGSMWVTNNKITADTTAAAWDVTFAPAVTQSLTNGDTRPVSSDATFDGLALKPNLAGGNTFTGEQTLTSAFINFTDAYGFAWGNTYFQGYNTGIFRVYSNGVEVLRGGEAAAGFFGAVGGAGSSGVIAFKNGTQGAAIADTVQLVSEDLTAGNTIPSIQTEGSGIVGGGLINVLATTKIAVKINGVVYYLLATTNGT